MDITVKVKELNAILPSLVAVADKKNTSMPALEHLRFETGKRDVSIVGGDLNLWTFAEALATVTKPGKGTVSAKMFGDLISKLDGDEVRLTVLENFRLRVQCGKSKHEIPGMDPTLYPAVPEIKGEFKTVSGAAMVNGIKGVIWSVSHDDTRAHLAGVHMRYRGGRMEFTATNGHTAARNYGAVDMPGVEITIPTKAENEVVRLSDGVETVEIAAGEWKGNGYLFIRSESISIAARLISDAFAAVDNVMPSRHAVTAETNKTALLAALRRCSVTDIRENKSDPRVTLEIGSNAIGISNAEKTGMEEVPAETSGPALTIGVSNNYMNEATVSLDADRVVIECNDELSPIIIRPVNGDGIRVVMPMRL